MSAATILSGLWNTMYLALPVAVVRTARPKLTVVVVVESRPQPSIFGSGSILQVACDLKASTWSGIVK